MKQRQAKKPTKTNISIDNISESRKQVKRNKGASGIDRMEKTEALIFLKTRYVGREFRVQFS